MCRHCGFVSDDGTRLGLHYGLEHGYLEQLWLDHPEVV